MSVASGITIGWAGPTATIPAGFSRNGLLDANHVRGAAASADTGAIGGSATHTHTGSGHTHSVAAHTHTAAADIGAGASGSGPNAGAGAVPAVTHIHTYAGLTIGTSSIDTAPSATSVYGSQGNDPASLTVIWVQSDGTPSGLPAYAVSYWNSATLPSGWSQHPAAKATYLKGAASATDGGVSSSANTHFHSGGSGHTHTAGAHTHAGPGGTITSSTGSPTANITIGGPNSQADTAHTHTLSVTTWAATSTASGSATSNTSTSDGEPPYYTLAIVQNSSGATSLPVGVICVWTGTIAGIPAGWTLCNGASGTPDLRTQFIRGANLLSEIGNTGGAINHTHTGAAHFHTFNHAHSASPSTAGSDAGTGSGGAATTYINLVHAHTVTTGTVALNTDSATDTATAPTDTRPPFVDVLFVQYSLSGTVAITAPTTSQVEALPVFAATWTLSGGRTQATYDLVVYDATGLIVVWDSGVIPTATQGGNVTAAAALANSTSYKIGVTTVDTNGVVSASALVAFSTSWVAPAAVSGLAVAAVTSGLPHNHVSWTQVVPAGGDTFVRYNILRRLTGTTAYTRIGAINTVSTVTFDDYTAASGQSYDYTVTESVTRSAVALDSVAPAAVACTLSFTSVFLHDQGTPGFYTEVQGNAMEEQAVQAITSVLGWNRQAPTVYIGSGQSSHIKITSVPQVVRTNQTLWNNLTTLITRQRTNASTLCLRDGETGGRWFGLLMPNSGGGVGGVRGPGAERKDKVGSTQTTIDFDETNFSEAV